MGEFSPKKYPLCGEIGDFWAHYERIMPVFWWFSSKKYPLWDYFWLKFSPFGLNLGDFGDFLSTSHHKFQIYFFNLRHYIIKNSPISGYFSRFRAYFGQFMPKICDFSLNLVEIEIFLSTSHRQEISDFDKNMPEICDFGLNYHENRIFLASNYGFRGIFSQIYARWAQNI